MVFPIALLIIKKKRRRDKQKNHSTLDRSVKFRENMWENVHVFNRVVYVYLCLHVYNYKRKMNHRLWSMISMHDLRIHRRYTFLLY